MMRRKAAATAAAAVCVLWSGRALADTWVVLVAGSKGYMNYRHQADMCHAKQIVSRYGVPADHIITMMYDDVANSQSNPVPGTLFNKPTPEGEPGWNVYEGCLPTYRDDSVTKENFLAVLTGNSEVTGGGPVLRSSSDDHVFVSFFDHGAPGLISMPVGEPVYANELLDALKLMSVKGMYGKLVFYLEACESGSMFEGLISPDMGILVTTAANPQESSWGTYCGADASVNGININSCLGDLYSVNWMEESDLPWEFHGRSLKAQYEYVKEKTDKSHVQIYGDRSFVNDIIADFQGGAPSVPTMSVDFFDRMTAVAQLEMPKNSVSSRDIHKFTLVHMLETATTPAERKEAEKALDAEIRHRDEADEMFGKLLSSIPHHTNVNLGSPLREGPLTNLACLRPAHEAVQAWCGRYSDYSMKHAKIITGLCEEGVSVSAISQAAAAACGVSSE